MVRANGFGTERRLWSETVGSAFGADRRSAFTFTTRPIGNQGSAIPMQWTIWRRCALRVTVDLI